MSRKLVERIGQTPLVGDLVIYRTLSSEYLPARVIDSYFRYKKYYLILEWKNLKVSSNYSIKKKVLRDYCIVLQKETFIESLKRRWGL